MEGTNQGRPDLTPVVTKINPTAGLLRDIAAAPVVEGSLDLPAAQTERVDVSHIVEADSLDEALGLSLGAASVMWDADGVFLVNNVLEIQKALRHRINRNTKDVLLDFLTWYTNAATKVEDSIEDTVQVYWDRNE